MEKILLFSNSAKLKAVSKNFANREDVKLIDTHKLLFHNKIKNSFERATDMQHRGVYLAFDGLSMAEFNSLIDGHDKRNFLILKHTKPDLPQFFDGFKHIYTGRNSTRESGGKIYPEVVEIFQDEKAEKHDRIKNAIIKINHLLEAKITFLESIFCEGDKPKVDELLQPYQTVIERFMANKSDDILSIEFINAYERLLSDLNLE